MSGIEFNAPRAGVATIVINRPHRKNALNWEAMEAFASAVEAAHEAADLRVLIVVGTADSFCAGGDLLELNDFPTRADGARLTTIMGDALSRLEALSVPTIAAINGPALGGGAEVALACDLRIMEESAIMGCMHLRLGIVPAWGGGQRLMRAVGYPLAFEWLAMGKVLRAPEAYEHGLANRVVDDGESRRVALEMAEHIAGYDPAAVRSVKRLLQDGLRMAPEEALLAERALFPELWAAPAHLEASERFVTRDRVERGP